VFNAPATNIRIITPDLHTPGIRVHALIPDAEIGALNLLSINGRKHYFIPFADYYTKKAVIRSTWIFQNVWPIPQLGNNTILAIPQPVASPRAGPSRR
jgi:hypothetical protein